MSMSQRLQIDSGTDELLAEIRGRVAIVTLNRPASRNALSSRIKTAWRPLLQRFGEDPQVGAILISAAGPAFCAGGDTKGMSLNAGAGGASFEDRVGELRADQMTWIGTLTNLRKPTVAAIQGPAAGAGLALALACDIRIAAQSSFLTTAYARVALSGDCGIAWLLTRLVGYSRARELMFLPERIDAQRAEALGLVNRVVPDADLSENAFALATELAEGPTAAFGYMKDNLDYAISSGLNDSMDYEAENLIRAEMTLDHAEGVRAFIEKRKPAFKGH